MAKGQGKNGDREASVAIQGIELNVMSIRWQKVKVTTVTEKQVWQYRHVNILLTIRRQDE
jgi:hypothetical protein